MSTIRTPITDRNGVQSHRWKRPQVDIDPTQAVPALGSAVADANHIQIQLGDDIYDGPLEHLHEDVPPGVYTSMRSGEPVDVLTTETETIDLAEARYEQIAHSEMAHAIRRARMLRSDDTEVVALLHELRAKYLLLESGRTRAVFDRGDGYVIKVATTDEGDSGNALESMWESERIPLAACHLEEMGDQVVLIMEKVTPSTASYEELPAWCGWVDGAQVGHTADGRLVAYDL